MTTQIASKQKHRLNFAQYTKINRASGDKVLKLHLEGMCRVLEKNHIVSYHARHVRLWTWIHE